MRLLFVGDIIGGMGRDCLRQALPRHPADFVVVNGENTAAGFGLSPKLFAELRAAGADVVTSGNHIWNRKEILPLLEAREERLLRPANMPAGAFGRGWTVVEKQGVRVAVINLIGRVFMEPNESPFTTLDALLTELAGQAEVTLVDFHAEASAEKQALAWHTDGRVGAIIGTHTHVQTADERLLPRGTAFITDVGMTGPRDSVIGVRPEQALHKMVTGMPVRFEVASGPCIFNALLLECDPGTGRVVTLQRIFETYTAQGG